MSVALLILVLLASAFFSGLELAFVSANKVKVELAKKSPNALGRILTRYFAKPARFLGVTLTGNNIALVVYGGLMAKLLEPALDVLIGRSEIGILLAQTLISTIIILLVGEFIPKNLFRLNPSGIIRWVAIPFYPIYLILSPFANLVVFLAKILLKLFFGIRYEAEKTVISRVDLQNLIEETQGADEPGNEKYTDLFAKALEFKDLKVRECMVPRPDIVAVDKEEISEAVLKSFLESKHSKLIVYDDNIDNVMGYYHHLDLMKQKTKDGKPRLWSMPSVPETTKARSVLNMLIKSHKSIAQVVDEYGGTAGIVTLEDLLEEIFGEIHDEHDDERLHEKELGDNTYEFSARLEIDYLNEQYPLNIPEGDYETLAGFIVTRYGSIPEEGMDISIPPYQFHIKEVNNARIEAIFMRVLDEE